MRQRIALEDAATELRLTLLDATARIAGLNTLLALRKDGVLARVDALPELAPPPTDGPPNDTGLETETFSTEFAKNLQISYYLYDHLGTTRIVFHTVLDCQDVEYVAEYVADYYPYGKVLREWVQCDVERYLTTQHERDKESGYDYRGARFYDADLGRFLSVDPLAAEYAAWSPYNYVLGNPVLFVDEDGREPTPKQAAAIANHVYNPSQSGRLPGGWVVSSRNFGVELKDNRGFLSAVYERPLKNGGTEYVYATAGSTDRHDWSDNFEQIYGTAEQYSTSVSNAQTIASLVGSDELTFVGHSLGGGLASANALKTGRGAITFNAAGLSDQTRSNLTLGSDAACITAFVIEGEAVSYLQADRRLKAEGNIITLPSPEPYHDDRNPWTVYKSRFLSFNKRVKNHGMGVVINALNEAGYD